RIFAVTEPAKQLDAQIGIARLDIVTRQLAFAEEICVACNEDALLPMRQSPRDGQRHGSPLLALPCRVITDLPDFQIEWPCFIPRMPLIRMENGPCGEASRVTEDKAYRAGHGHHRIPGPAESGAAA